MLLEQLKIFANSDITINNPVVNQMINLISRNIEQTSKLLNIDDYDKSKTISLNFMKNIKKKIDFYEMPGKKKNICFIN